MGDIKAFADSTGLNLLEEGLRLQAKSIGKTLDDSSVTQSEQGARPTDGGTQDLLKRIEALCNRWRSARYVGFDATLGSEFEIIDGFDKALELLSDCYEELGGD